MSANRKKKNVNRLRSGGREFSYYQKKFKNTESSDSLWEDDGATTVKPKDSKGVDASHIDNIPDQTQFEADGATRIKPKDAKTIDSSHIDNLPDGSKWESLNAGRISPKDDTRIDTFHHTRYRDEYVAGPWVTPQGSTAPDLETVNMGGFLYRMYAFNGTNTTEVLYNSFEINHDIDVINISAAILNIEFHIHVMPSVSPASSYQGRFLADLYIHKQNGVPILIGQLELLPEFPKNQAQFTHVIIGKAFNFTLAGVDVEIGDIILFSLTRDPTDVGDTYPHDILFYKAALHVPLDSIGSRQMYIK